MSLKQNSQFFVINILHATLKMKAYCDVTFVHFREEDPISRTRIESSIIYIQFSISLYKSICTSTYIHT